MLISVIIPTFNRKNYCQRAIESVFAGTYKNIEVIVIDDGSTDGTDELLSKCDFPIQYFKTKNQGVSKARNFGVDKAKGQWISFLDSDDLWLENKLSKQVKLLEENPGLRLVHAEEIWIRNGVRVNQMNKHKKSGGDIFEASLKLCLISPSAVLLEKSLFIEMGGFREDFVVCEDYDLWLKIASIYPVGFVKEPLIKKFGGHDDQLSRKFFAMDYWRVRSLSWILEHRELDEDKRESVLRVLKKKCRILLNGYKKHQNFKDYDEVEKILTSHL